jgi:hypothetical protein
MSSSSPTDETLEQEFDDYAASIAAALFGPIDTTAPVYTGPPRWHSFDLDRQAIDALRHVADLLPRAPADPYLWKWIVIAMFDAMHAVFGLALRRGDGAQLLTKQHERRTYRRWNDERRLGHAILDRAPDRVDDTRSLYAKVLDPERMGYLGGSPLTPTTGEEETFAYLARLRDHLTHYGHDSHSVFVGELPLVILTCLSMIAWLVEQSGTIRPRPEKRDQLRAMIRRVRQEAEAVARIYELEVFA